MFSRPHVANRFGMDSSNHGLVKVHIYESVAVECAGMGAGTSACCFHLSQSALSYVKRRVHTGQSLLTGNSVDVHLGHTRKVLQRGNISQYEETNSSSLEEPNISTCLPRFFWRSRLHCDIDP